jgi:hypothetical protein
MLATNDRPSHALKAALDMARDPAWLNGLQGHVGSLRPEKAGDWPVCCYFETQRDGVTGGD